MTDVHNPTPRTPSGQVDGAHRARTAALLAGAIGLLLIEAGTLLIEVTVARGTFTLITVSVGSVDVMFNQETSDFLAAVDAPAVFAWLILLGAGLITAGIVLSVKILRAGGLARPRAVTWSAVGFAAIILLVINVPAVIFGALPAQNLYEPGLLLNPSTVVALIMTLAVATAVGPVLWASTLRGVQSLSRRSAGAEASMSAAVPVPPTGIRPDGNTR
ncbi:MAG: hypothetical protein RI885_1247 [Actinomycetota bacterium]